MIPYVSEGQQPTAAQLNRLAADLDGALQCLFGGHSWLVYQMTRGFLRPPMGRIFCFGSVSGRRIVPFALGSASRFPEYNHSVFETIASGLTPTHWFPEVDIAAVSTAAEWHLNASLEAHTRQLAGPSDASPRKYWLAKFDPLTQRVTSRECSRRHWVAEIVVEGWSGGPLVWDAKWNKYHFLRFHNLDSTSLTVSLPGATLSIPPFGIQATRRIYPNQNTWISSHRYLWAARSGDWLILDGIRENNVASLLCYHETIDTLRGLGSNNPTRITTGTTEGLHEDPRVIWSSGASLLPQPIDPSTPLGRYAFHLGEILSIASADTTAVPMRTEIETWEQLLGAGVGGVRGQISGGVLSILPSAAAPVDALGISSNLLPQNPVTLPHLVTSVPGGGGFGGGVGGIGAVATAGSVSATYFQDGTFPLQPIQVSTGYDSASEIPGGLYQLAGFWDALSSHAIPVAFNGQLHENGASSFASDGWRLVLSGTTRLPAESGIIPNLALSEITPEWITTPWASDLLGRQRWDMIHRREPRRTSAYVGETDLFGFVTHQGHADLSGTYGAAGGLDYDEVRSEPADVDSVRLTGVPPVRTETNTLPVRPRDDAVERILAGINSPGWYASERASLLSGTLKSSDRQRVIRVPLLREHYNHVAQRINSITAVTPCTFRDALWWGDLDDGTAPAEIGPYRPPGWYATVDPSGRAAAIGVPIASATVTGKTITYVTVSAVATRARELGFRFALQRLDAPYLETVVTEELDGGFFGGVTRQTVQFWPAPSSGSAMWRRVLETYCLAGHYLLTGYGLYPPPGRPDSDNPAQALDVVSDVRMGSAPSGWTLANETHLLTLPRPVIGWQTQEFADNPTQYPGVTMPLEVIQAPAGGGLLWPVAVVGNEITPQSIAALYDVTIDPRAGYQVRLARRVVFSR